jgi:hypothetical protein
MSIEDGCKSLWYIKYVVLKEKKKFGIENQVVDLQLVTPLVK